MKVLFPICLALTCATVSAQGATLKAHTNVGIFTGDTKSLILSAVKSGTLLKDPLNLQVNTRSGVTSSSQISLRTTDNFHVVSIADRGGASVQSTKGAARFGTTTSLDPKNVKQGPFSVLLTVKAPVGAKAKVRVRYSGKLLGTAFARAFVDIGNDNKVEFQRNAGAEVEKEFIAVASAKGIQIRIGTDAGADFKGAKTAGYETGLVVIVMPQPSCSFTSYGKGCGPVLTGSSISTPGGAIVMHNVTGAPKASPGGVIVGAKKLSLKIPGTSCFLLTEPMLLFPFFVNAQGKAKIVLGSGPEGPFTFFSQALILERTTGKPFSSNGLVGDCK